MTTTKIMKCNCDHDYQDSIYGKGRRVHNATHEGNTMRVKGYRCTSCGDEKLKRRGEG